MVRIQLTQKKHHSASTLTSRPILLYAPKGIRSEAKQVDDFSLGFGGGIQQPAVVFMTCGMDQLHFVQLQHNFLESELVAVHIFIQTVLHIGPNDQRDKRHSTEKSVFFETVKHS